MITCSSCELTGSPVAILFLVAVQYAAQSQNTLDAK